MSKSTIQRHRLIVTLAWCLHRQELSQAILASEAFSVWRTLDLTLEIGFEWLMYGASYMKHSDMPRALALSAQLGTVGTERDREVHAELENLVYMHQGVPCGVGSGNQALKNKIDTLAHSEKLTTQTWSGTAKLLGATATVVGDLGESSISKGKCNLKTLVGNWIATEDGMVEAEVEGADDDFDFQVALIGV